MHVLIATHGRPTLLQRTLESLSALRLPKDLRQIIVVENGSDAGARATCEGFADRLPLAYHHRANAGKTPALQWAIDNLIPSGLIVFFDDDIRVAPDALDGYAAAARSHGRGHYLGGPLEVDYEQPPPQWLASHLPTSARGWTPSVADRERGVARFLGANFAVFAEDIQAIGGFNLSLGAGDAPPGEEMDLQARLVENGCRSVWVPEAVVWHYVPKERCTPKWALHREYRTALGLTLRMKEINGINGAQLFGVPRWMLRQYLGVWLSAKAASLRPLSAEQRFQLRWREAHYRGKMAAVKQRLAQQPDALNSEDKST